MPGKTLFVSICTPTAGKVEAVYCLSLEAMVLHFLTHPILAQQYQSKNVRYQLRVGANIGEGRDQMVDVALEQGDDYVLFIDDDMGFEPQALNVALSRQMPIVLANYRRKAPPGVFTAAGIDKDDNTFEIVTTKEKDSLEEAWVGGFGFCLIQTDVFKQIPKPRFLMTYMPETDRYTTEDYPFFTACRKAGIMPYVDHRLSKLCWHVGSYAYQWDDDNLTNAKARNRKE